MFPAHQRLPHASVTIALALTALFAGAIPSHAQSAAYAIEVTEVRVGEGPVVVDIFRTDNNWPEEPWQQVTLAADTSALTATFEVPAGDYAVSVYQDLDEDGEIDRNFIGIPKEPVAFGNNDQPFGSPDYEDSVVRFDASYRPQRLELYKVLF